MASAVALALRIVGPLEGWANVDTGLVYNCADAAARPEVRHGTVQHLPCEASDEDTLCAPVACAADGRPGTTRIETRTALQDRGRVLRALRRRPSGECKVVLGEVGARRRDGHTEARWCRRRRARGRGPHRGARSTRRCPAIEPGRPH